MNRISLLLESLLLSLALAAALACSPDPAEIADGADPLAALRASAPTSRFKEPYWSEQCYRKSAAWKAALAFCRGEGQDPARFPNCQHVRIVSRWDEPLRLPPPSFHFGDVQGLRDWERRLPASGTEPFLPAERP